MKFSPLVLFLSLVAGSTSAFPNVRLPSITTTTPTTTLSTPRLFVETESSASTDTDKEDDEDPLGLTPELRKITNAFEMIGDDKLRYKQLLYMAGQLPALEHPAETMIPSNKVPGCLSTVYVDGTATFDTEKDAFTIDFVGDSDGLLTKGLVALLVRGMSGCTAEEIQKVQPEFINQAKISQSLTPGRNNGFLNMLSSMKQKALQLEEQAKAGAPASSDAGAATLNDGNDNDALEEDSDRPMYNAMMTALQKLQPTSLTIIDNSDQHAGHVGSKGYDGESHFDLDIVADAFEGLSLVQRHKLIYMLLGDVMDKIHALQISRAKTPAEASE
eukprot:CAMPEP_0195294518 /NCGR_PEP_ID=MMETSP0707-20130614/15234_1 /TAXON_ID=33640 /ORGANISM="Asterionellopsis glacialis, Strain CCMP134" /LENGTH=329 /DNA_ID=CAMNT_0040355513 /DNA_START=44 /DNA_END=1033 /DNA_ORIENTATION=+